MSNVRQTTADRLTRDIEHNHDAPSNGPLLSTDETTTLGWWSNLRDVDRDLSRAYTDAEAVDDATDDQHWDVLRSRHNDAANDPDDGADSVWSLAAVSGVESS